MQNDPLSNSPTPPATFKTATAMMNPVLIRLGGARGTILLAQDASYDKAGKMHLFNVRWVRRRSGLRRLWGGTSEPFYWSQGEVRLHISPNHVTVALQHQPTLRVKNRRRSFATIHLPGAQYDALRTASADRLLLAAEQYAPTPRRNLTAAALEAAHRLRITLRNALLPAR